MISSSLDQLNKEVDELNQSIGTLGNTAVKLTGNQTVAGIKTFSSSPVVPTPTTNTQAVNKAYADLKVALAAFTGANVSLAGNGYQKLPSGLIIQWGASMVSSGGTITLPTIFPSVNILVLTSVVASSGTIYTTTTGEKTNSNFVAYHNHTAPISIGFIAIGW